MAKEFSILAKVKLDTANIQQQLDAFSNRSISLKADTKDFDLSISVANAILNKFIDTGAAMVDQVTEMDSALVEFRKVSDLSGESLERYTEQLGELGRVTARTTSQMVDAATQFKKSGFSDEDSKTLALIATEYQNVADVALSAGEAANFIISQMKAFNINAEESEHIIDAVNEISNNYAVSSADLATNIGKASAALAIGNNTYEQSLSMLTAITEINRNGAKSARGLVSIQSRLNQILDDTSSTGKKLIEFYDKHNIQIYDEQNQLKSLYEIMSLVAEQWDTLSTNEQKYFLNIQAGANQSAQLGALLQNFTTAQEALATALNSSGSAMKENERYMQSIEARVSLLKADFQILANDIINSQLIKSILTLTDKLIQLADTGLGQILTKIVLLTGIEWGASSLLKASKILPNIIGQFKTLALVIKGLSGEGATLIGVLKGVGGAGGATAAVFGSALPIFLAVTAAVVGLVAIIKKLKDEADPFKQLNDGIERLEDLQDKFSEKEQLLTLIDRYQELREKVDLTIQEEQELANIRSQLSTATHGVVSENGDYNDSLDDTIAKLETATEWEQERIKVQVLADLVGQQDDYRKALDAVANSQQQINTLTDKQRTLAIDATNLASEAAQAWETGNLTRLQEVYDQLADILGIAFTQHFPTEDVTQFFYAYGESAEQSAKGLEYFLNYISRAQQQIDKVNNKVENLDSTTQENQNTIKNFQHTVVTLEKAGILPLTNALSLLNITQEEYNDLVEEMEASTKNTTTPFEELEEIIAETSATLEAINTEIDNTQTALKTLIEAQDEYNTTGELSIDTIQSLLELDAEYLNALIDENGQINLNSEAISTLIEGKNVLLERLAAEAIATYAAEEMERQYADQIGTTSGVADSASGTLQALATTALQSGQDALTASTGWMALWKAIRGQGEEVGLDDAHMGAAISNIQQYAASVQSVISSASVGLGGWQPSDTKGRKSGGSRSSTEKVKTQLEQWEDDLKTIENHYSNILSLTESEYSLLVDQGALSEDIIAKAQEYQNLLHEENEALREFLAQIPNIPENQDLINEIQTKINKNSSTWWDWAKKINDEYEKIAKAAQDAAEEAEKVIKSLADAWDDEIEQQKEALLALQGQMEDYYSGLIDDIDKQIEALNAANDALDQQITYEEKLDAIAKARQSKAMVYKDGRWQYVEDIDAVSTAVKEFEDFTRERNLKEQIDALEREKDALENMKNAWSDFTKSYENDMDKWLINQKLGIDTSLAEWQRLIDGVGAYMTQYSNLMNATNPYGTMQYKTATGGTKGYGTTTTAGGEVYYTSDKAIKFIENAKAGTLMTDTADGSTWYKESDTKTVITAADGTTSAVIDLSNPNTSVVSSGSTSSSKSTSHSKEGAKYSLSKHANGTLSALGGLSLVGEHGAELRVLNQGDGIIPADLTQNLMLWGRVNPIQYASQYVGDKLNSAMNVTIQALNLPSVTNGQEFVDYIRNNLFGQVLSYVH